VLALGCNSDAKRQALRDQVVLEIRHGDIEAASRDAERGFHLYAPGNEEWGWRFRLLRAQVLLNQSKADEALTLLKEPLPSALSAGDIAVHRLMIEGLAYRIRQDFGSSEQTLLQAQQLAEATHSSMLSDVLNSKGALEFDQKKYPLAEQTFSRALVLAREGQDTRQEAAAQMNLARIATLYGHYGEGTDRNQVALQLSKRYEYKSFEATCLGNLGWSSFQMGDFDSAVEFFKEAAEKSQRVGLTGYAFYWQGFLAQTYQELNDYVSAKSLLITTVENARKLGNKQTMTENLNYLVRLSLKTNQLDDADRYNREALQIEETGQDHFGVLETRLLAGRIAMRRRDFQDSEKFIRQVIEDPAAATETFLKWEAEGALAEMHDAESLPALSDQEHHKSIATFERARSEIDRDDLRLSFLARGIASYDAYIDFLMRHERAADALKIAEQSRARTLEEGLAATAGALSYSPRNVAPQQTAQRLHASLLFYWIGEKNSYLWVITPAKTAWFKLANAGEIEPLVKSYRKAVLEMHDAQDAGSDEGKQLYSMLVEPAKKLIPAGSRVIVLPSESLYGLNFETLIVPDPQPHFWIEDVTVTTGNSLSLLASSATRAAPKEKSLFLVGDTESPGPAFPPLPQVREEMKLVEKYFPQSQTKVLEGKQATPSAYLGSNPERFSYVHFVTHGTASQTRPLESAVILSKEGDSYKLYARDIVKHHLNASLVTISACNGSGTRAYSGEGLVGLSWAFLRAGAHNVIGALWEVSEASTPQLMDAFYGELFQDKDPATALRDAKLKLLHSADADSVFKKPFYWAPFQLYAGS
jgi:CHAT domain-containing protein